MSDIRLIDTQDGSHSLYVTSMNETYHSFHGALQESLYIYIKMGIHYYLDKLRENKIRVLEVGLGTGLNALLTYRDLAKKKVKTWYDTIEPFPVEKELWSKLNYVELVDFDKNQEIFSQIHECDWDTKHELSEGYLFCKYREKIENIELLSSHYDVVYFDAFAPNKQAEMWQISILKKVVDSMKSGGVLVTYCAQGQFKRDIKEAGLEVKTLPGPLGKKEMVRGLKPMED